MPSKKHKAISTKPPLQLILLRDKKDADMLVFEEAVERAFKGGPQTSGYVATGEDLGVEIRKFDVAPRLRGPLSALVDGACHTIVIALVGPEILNSEASIRFLVDVWSYIRAGGKHSLVLFCANEAIGEQLFERAPTLKSNLAVAVDQLAERALRPAFISLRILHEARKRLALALTDRPGAKFLTLFISHAKLDGLPLAQSIKHLVGTLPWLESFYDARDLAGTTDWEAALENAAKSSLLIILRTDNYEERPWCQQETLWAEETAAPTVLVEARPGLVYPAGELPLERMPSVRIPDGNLYRILHVALRESLRYLLFQRRVQEMVASKMFPPATKVVPFSYPPSMSALLRATRNIGSAKAIIIYPDPPLRRGLYEAAIALVKASSPKATLVTPTMLTASKP
jgi:hypothetical protein